VRLPTTCQRQKQPSAVDDKAEKIWRTVCVYLSCVPVGEAGTLSQLKLLFGQRLSRVWCPGEDYDV